MSIYLIPTIPAIGNVGRIQQATGLRAVITGHRVRLVNPGSFKSPAKATYTPRKATHSQGMDKPFGGDAA
ncbi:hypothetical protein G8770_03700 [Aestuariicella hydrocarbonica]|uniref:Uncharacterized protein n=1 Tax=Pseudomaricurvus hydrocarbonicus TaxID=1470433 RepID=A0A9E5JU75_9GAMM|nr:hypothetical protein [Aestuariicella hydrocarbonica]NHO64650.1 hypothetical protein [Aestuariicella hydrocarbonica]